ncbi:MAG: hypothetical protein Kow0032_07340 [Methyloligellaceae bacterium]
MRAEIRGGEIAVTRAMRKAGFGLRDDWREQVRRGQLGNRLPRTIRAQIYPQGQESISAAALVYTRAPEIIDAFDRGALIRSEQGFWLAIPTEAAGKYGDNRKRITPGGWERRMGIRLRFVYRRNAPSLLVADLRVRKGRRGGFAKPSRRALKSGRDLASVPIFILLPQVKLRKRLDLNRATERWRARVPGLILENWPDLEGAD